MKDEMQPQTADSIFEKPEFEKGLACGAHAAGGLRCYFEKVHREFGTSHAAIKDGKVIWFKK